MSNPPTAPTYALQLEALLFALGKPLSRTEIQKLLECTPEQCADTIAHLAQAQDRGIVLVDDGEMVELRTNPQTQTMLDRIYKDENERDIGKAGLEVLAAVLYRGPLTRNEIDFIRGVNSSQTVRNLTMRGLIRKGAPASGRSVIYEPTTELLAALSLTTVSDAPEYASLRSTLQQLEVAYKAAQTNTEQA